MGLIFGTRSDFIAIGSVSMYVKYRPRNEMFGDYMYASMLIKYRPARKE
jgi:hypothetical protein